jgi:acyl-CoA synthetase (AMP-forming)/AMP-acid ligase II/acyl carrier protein
MLIHQSIQQGDKTAFYFIDSTAGARYELSYLELDRSARSIGASLLSQGYPLGARVILIYPPGLELIKAFFGCLYAGLVAVPVYPPTNTKLVEKLQNIVVNAEPSVILSTKNIIAQLRQLRRVKWLHQMPVLNRLTERFFSKAVGLSHWNMGRIRFISTDIIPLDMANKWVMPSINRDSLAFFQYTSGSTGVPKGVMLRHGNLLHNLGLIQKSYNLHEIDIGVSWLPPYHDMGLIGMILESLYIGTTTHHMSPVDFLKNPARWLQIISDIEGSVISGAPNFAYDYCVRKIPEEQRGQFDLSRWGLALNGAEPVRAPTLRAFAEAFASSGFSPLSFKPSYGMAEACLFISCTARALAPKTFMYQQVDTEGKEMTKEIVGCGIPADEVIIVSAEDSHRCLAYEIGEVCHYSASVAAGYWRQEEESARTFHFTLEGDDRYYLRTGDLGFLDEQGELFITGRLKDLIIIRGINYYPQDIEFVASHAHQLLRADQCVACSITVSEDEQLAVICETDSQELTQDGTLLVDAIRESITSELGISVHTVALIKPRSLLKTTSGKVRRKDSREALLSNQLDLLYRWEEETSLIEPTVAPQGLWLAELRGATDADRYALLIHYLQVLLSGFLNQMEPNKINPDRHFVALGLDSILMMEFIACLQQQLGSAVSLSPTVLFDYPDIRSLAKYILSQDFSCEVD